MHQADSLFQNQTILFRRWWRFVCTWLLHVYEYSQIKRIRYCLTGHQEQKDFRQPYLFCRPILGNIWVQELGKIRQGLMSRVCKWIPSCYEQVVSLLYVVRVIRAHLSTGREQGGKPLLEHQETLGLLVYANANVALTQIYRTTAPSPPKKSLQNYNSLKSRFNL